MPTTIDAQNALQIRKPMDIYVTFEAIDTDLNLNASTSGLAPKLAEYANITEIYEMRKLADLQGEGFPLDDSCVLYDPSVVSSEENGKIGVRGNVGQNFTIRFAPGVVLPAITANTTAESVTYNGDDFLPDINGEVTVPLTDFSYLNYYELTFNAYDSTVRAEVAWAASGFELEFTSDDIISINLSLRSDLKPIDPSLPESEIEITAYYPDDISNMLASVRDDKPITYSAGYDDDTSYTRRFYLSEPASWNNKVITIKGVDLIHMLDKETFPMLLGKFQMGTYYNSQYQAGLPGGWAFNSLYRMAEEQIYIAGIDVDYSFLVPEEVRSDFDPSETIDNVTPAGYQNSLIKRQTQRDLLANLMNLLHLDFPAGIFTIESFWLNYVDAGIPRLTWKKPSVKWDIYEEDCGSVQNFTERNMANVTFSTGTVHTKGATLSFFDGGSTVFKDSGIGLEYPDYTTYVDFGIRSDTSFLLFNSTVSDSKRRLPISPPHHANGWYGIALYDGEVDKDSELRMRDDGGRAAYFPRPLWVSWNTRMDQRWRAAVSGGVIQSSATSANLDARGYGVVVTNTKSTQSTGKIGLDVIASKTNWIGVFSAGKKTSGTVKLLPDEGFKQILARSNETGSFTWKGDPRMQPRDFFNFHRLDGTVEVCTIETISLKHEKGGTQAQITYRKGMV